MTSRIIPRVVLSIALPVIIWSIAAGLGNPRSLPGPVATVCQIIQDGWAFYQPNIVSTLGEASLGFLWGNGLAVVFASLAVLLPLSRRLIVQLGTISISVPVIALGPVLAIVFTGRVTTITLAALAVFFNSLLALLQGFAVAERSSLDLIAAYGGGRWQTFRKLQLVAALPSLFAALEIAAPAAVLGSIVGEWLGSSTQGLGVAMVIAMQQMNPARTWGIALVCGSLASLAYWGISLVGRLATPWEQARVAPEDA